jgi:antitoxin (DNA-binding transcriptional repressor) of toxin-antitoxin stability system
MKIASISQTKNQLSALLDLVKQGETVLIMDRDRPVARLEPVVSTEFADDEGRLARLERAGIIRRAKAPPPLDILREPPPKPKEGGSVLQALLEEREEGR